MALGGAIRPLAENTKLVHNRHPLLPAFLTLYGLGFPHLRIQMNTDKKTYCSIEDYVIEFDLQALNYVS